MPGRRDPRLQSSDDDKTWEARQLSLLAQTRLWCDPGVAEVAQVYEVEAGISAGMAKGFIGAAELAILLRRHGRGVASA